MTEELKAIIKRITCSTCLGNGILGGRVTERQSSDKTFTTFRDVGRPCPDCGGHGHKPIHLL